MGKIDAISIFGPGGAASRVLDGFSPRNPQVTYAGAVLDLLGSEAPRIGLLDAETGTGKSLGYLVPLIHDLVVTKKGRVVISTASISLQKQILVHDVPAALRVVADMVGRDLDLSVAMRVGRSQVLDPVKVSELADDLPREDRDAAERVLAWAEDRIAEGVLPLRREAQADLFAGEPRPVFLGDAVAFDGDISTSRTDLWALYAEAIADAENADILIVNHHLLALDLSGAEIIGAARQPVRLVVDEADRLPDVLDQMSRSKVQFQHLTSLATALSGKDETTRIRELVDLLSSADIFGGSDRFPGAAGEIIPVARMAQDKRQQLMDVVGEIRQRASRIATQSGQIGGSPIRREQASELRLMCDQIADFERRVGSPAKTGVPVFYCSPVRRFTGIMVGNPVAKAKMTAFGDPERFGVVLLTAATLSSGADTPGTAFAPFLTGSGLRDLVDEDHMKVIESEQFGEMTFVRPDPDAPSGMIGETEEVRMSPETVAYAGRMVRAAAAEGGNVLVLCPSHNALSLVAEAVDGLDGVLVQGRGMAVSVAQAAAERMQQDGERVVWLSASAWEGMSMPGFFSHIVIVRLPIRGRGVEDDLLAEYLTGLGKTEAFARSLTFSRMMADARRRLRQGIGRGIRVESDSVKVWFADSRFPLPQQVIDAEMRDQPRSWSSTFVKAIPTRFRAALEASPSFGVDG